MNLDNTGTVADEGSLPSGYGRWSEVPDHIVPVRLVVSSSAGKANQPTAQRPYVKGQLPLDWLVAVANSGHSKALYVALAIKIQTDRRREIWVKPSYQIIVDLGVGKMDLSRCMKALEKAGLIEVQRRNGRPPLIRLSAWKGDSSG